MALKTAQPPSGSLNQCFRPHSRSFEGKQESLLHRGVRVCSIDDSCGVLIRWESDKERETCAERDETLQRRTWRGVRMDQGMADGSTHVNTEGHDLESRDVERYVARVRIDRVVKELPDGGLAAKVDARGRRRWRRRREDARALLLRVPHADRSRLEEKHGR